MARTALLAFLFSFSLFAQTAIVSDLDETIKRTGTSTLEAIINAFFTQRIYAGMDQLYRTMDAYSDGLYIVTASPYIVRYNIWNLIYRYDLPVDGLYTRIALEDKFKYKYDSVLDVLAKGYSDLILIGDDTSKDAFVYDKVKADYPTKVSAIYIHEVKGNKIPESAIKYFTVYEIALHEYKAGRMNYFEVRDIGEGLLGRKMKKLFPKFTVCPERFAPGQFPEFKELKELTEMVKNKIANYCRKAALLD